MNGHLQQPRNETGARPAVDLDLLIDQLKLVIANPEVVSASATNAQRSQFQQLARSAAVALEEPFDTLQRLVYSPFQLVTARISQENNIFSTLVSAKEPVDFTTLQDASGLDAGILEPVLTYLCSHDAARKVAPGRYSATRLTQLMMSPVFRDGITVFHDFCLSPWSALNSVLGNGPRARELAFQVGHHTDANPWMFLESRPDLKGCFHRFMEAQFAGLPTWLDAIDVESELAKGTTAADAVFVDVGGGSGQQCEAFKKNLHRIQGRVILQDRPEVLEKALVVEGMEKMSYDYLTEQPIKGARVYYFRQVLHNNDDETCIRILRSQLPAMGPDSVLIIDEKVFPDERPLSVTPGMAYTAALSLSMHSMFGALERRESSWRQLLNSAGFEVKCIRMFTDLDDAAIIAVPIKG